MSVEMVYRCDWRECEAHLRTTGNRMTPFLTVTEVPSRPLHFCTWDCLLKYAGEKPSVEIRAYAQTGLAR